MSKDDEQILVVRSDVVFNPPAGGGKWQGLKVDNLDYYIDLIKKNYEFKRRGDMENDPSYQQVIPYMLFNYRGSYFLYKYLPQAGEQRLVDTYQLGVGGHINKDDINGSRDVLEAGMMREWEEEVDYKGNLINKKLVGILNDETNPVERVHLGLVYDFSGDSADIKIRETEKMEGRLVNLENVGECVKENRSIWAQLVYKDYLSKKIG